MSPLAVRRSDTGPGGRAAADLTLTSTAEATRQGLRAVRVALARAGVCCALRSRVEMVLAEVLNNIADHAYPGGVPGLVRLRVAVCGGAVRVRVRDGGRPMPRGRLPVGSLPEREVPRQRLPEGGFGWFLIHGQSDSLYYRRHNIENILGLFFRPRGEHEGRKTAILPESLPKYARKPRH